MNRAERKDFIKILNARIETLENENDDSNQSIIDSLMESKGRLQRKLKNKK